MQVQVRYFAVLRERAGLSEESVDVKPETTVSELYGRLFPPEPHGSVPVMYAVNSEYVDSGHTLMDGDEVAFIPPLGGG